MKITHFSFNASPLIVVSSLMVMFCLWSNLCFAQNQSLISEGDKAIAQGDLDSAEKIFAKAAELNPEGYRALKALAEIKCERNKYEEANALIEKILDLEVTGGREVLVYRDGETGPQKGELVDETALKMEVSVRR